MLLKKIVKNCFFSFLMIAGVIAAAPVFAQETGTTGSQKIVYTEKQNAMRITANDIKMIEEKNDDGELQGYHLYIRKIKGVESVLLTETTRDPNGKADNYAYRALEYNPINGDEMRILDGKPLVSEGAKYSLIDSTTEKVEGLGDAFHIFIPLTLQFGYEWSRNGIVEIGRGTFINIRTFEKPYADYTGEYMAFSLISCFLV